MICIFHNRMFNYGATPGVGRSQRKKQRNKWSESGMWVYAGIFCQRTPSKNYLATELSEAILQVMAH